MPIDMPSAVFSDKEVTKFLEEDGYKPQTPEFWRERSRRYYKHGSGWAEQETWDGSRRKLVA